MENTDPDTAAKIRESIDKGWMPLYPSERDDSGRPDPRVMFVWRGNYFNQAKGNIAVEEELWPKLDLVVDINFRMDSTALNSDIVLPTASHYEKHDLSETDMHTYVHPFTPAVEPLGESKTDWQIFRDLAAKIQELAADRGTEPVDDRKFDRQIDLQSVHDDYVRDWLDDEPGALSEDKAAAEFILENSEETNPEGTDEQITFDEIDEQPKRLLETGDHWSSDIEGGEAYTPWKDYVQDKNPWPTFTGRQQYYIDHDWFLELDEQLPTHKEAPVLQEKSEYPLGYNTPHSRWSIHSTWRDSSKMLRLQRGEPTVYLNPDDAEERGSRTATPCGCTTTSTRSRCRRRSTERGARHRPALLQLGAVPVPRPQQLQFARPDVHEADAARPVPRGHGRAPPLLPELLGSDRREQRRSDRGREGRRGAASLDAGLLGESATELESPDSGSKSRGALGRVSDLLGGDD